MRRWGAIALLGAALLTAPAARAAIAMRISALSDFNLPTWSLGDPAIAAHIDLCIYALDILPPGGYAITVSSPGGFVLLRGGQQIPYSLTWEDSGAGALGSGGGTPLTNNVTLTGRLHGDVLFNDCALAGPNARLNLAITQASMSAALAGTYTGTITLLLSAS